MSKTKILIVEDEHIIAEDMANKLSKSGYDVTDCVDNCEDAIESVKNNPPDLIFMDIAISGRMDGIETAETLKLMGDFIVIFLTNLHDEKTMKRAMAVNPANYLHKPFTEHQLHVSIRTALINLAEQQKLNVTDDRDDEDEDEDVDDTITGNESSIVEILKDRIFIKIDDSIHNYNIADILYIEADRSYRHIHLKGGKKVTQVGNMGAALKKINHLHLMKVHRSYIVNLENIGRIKNNGSTLVFADEEVPVSDQFKKKLLKKLPILK